MRSDHQFSFAAILSGLVAMVVLAMALQIATTRMSAHTAQATPEQREAQTQQAVDTYQHIIAAGMASTSCAFSRLSTILAPNARLTTIGGAFATDGAKTPSATSDQQTYIGIPDITTFYVQSCHLLRDSSLAPPRWNQDNASFLTPNVLTVYGTYQVTDADGSRSASSMQVYSVDDSADAITSLDWSVTL